MTSRCICIYINCARETLWVTNHQQQAAALPVAFTSSMAEYKNVTVLRKSSLTTTASVLYIYSSEKENSSFKSYCNGENYLLCLFETSLYWQSIEGESFLSNMILDINLFVRIFFPIHPWLSAVLSPELSTGSDACERFVIAPRGSHQCLSPHLKKQLNCTTKPMASED